LGQQQFKKETQADGLSKQGLNKVSLLLSHFVNYC